MKAYKDMTKDELQIEYSKFKEKNLKLNMARGKPSKAQLDLSMPMLDILNSDSICNTADGIDCRNYGELTGIKEAKELFSKYMAVNEDEIIITGSSSLTFMYDTMARAMLKGVNGSKTPWGKLEIVKFLCPVPGYDRHFSICEFLGIEMINIPMNDYGPDMDMVEMLVANDSSIKGMWCVPKYSNPSGITYSDEVIRRLATMKTAADDFRIFYDNAYAMHYVYEDTNLLDLLSECKKYGTEDRVYMFGSTNKITFSGAGVAFFASSKANINYAAKELANEAISFDKLNMLRHVRFFKDLDGIRSQMKKHASLLKPRFDVVIDALDKLDIGEFTKAKGGYFISYKSPKGCAKKIVSLCKEAGLTLTSAGATHPYKNDPDDCYIRIAPSYPDIDELKTAMELFCLCVRLVV